MTDIERLKEYLKEQEDSDVTSILEPICELIISYEERLSKLENTKQGDSLP